MSARFGRFVVMLSGSAVVILGNAAGAGASPSLKPLTGEKLAASTIVMAPAQPVGGLPLICSAGTNVGGFSFSGTATGRYPGTFTENGTITYSLTVSPEDPNDYSGTVTDLSGSFSINSQTGTVIGLQRFHKTGTTGPAASCGGGLGGTDFSADPVATHYGAVIATPTRVRVDRGLSKVSLSSVSSIGPNGSTLNAAFSSN